MICITLKLGQVTYVFSVELWGRKRHRINILILTDHEDEGHKRRVNSS